jgi:hypothetical protein
MRDTDYRAGQLDAAVRMYVAREVFKSNWSAWYAQWRAFFTQTLDSKVGNLFHTDEIKQKADQYRSDLAWWQAAYAQERDDKGNALPSAGPPLPVPTPPNAPDAPTTSSGLSLWTVLAIVAGVGVAVGGYFYVKKGWSVMKAKRDAMEGILPRLLTPEFGEEGGKALAKVATARDAFAKGPSHCGCSPTHGRDLEFDAAPPRAGSKYILTGL